MYTFQQRVETELATAEEKLAMSVCLAEHYSSLSVEDCLGLGVRGHGGLTEDPLVDLPLLRGQGTSFALPPGVQVIGK